MKICRVSRDYGKNYDRIFRPRREGLMRRTERVPKRMGEGMPVKYGGRPLLSGAVPGWMIPVGKD